MWFQFGRRTALYFRLGPARAACNNPVWAEPATLAGRRKLPTSTQASSPVPTKQKMSGFLDSSYMFLFNDAENSLKIKEI